MEMETETIVRLGTCWVNRSKVSAVAKTVEGCLIIVDGQTILSDMSSESIVDVLWKRASNE